MSKLIIMRCFLSFLVFVIAELHGESSVASFNTFTSCSHLSMAGAGYLYPSPTALKTNPSSFKKYRKFETSIIKYPSDIISQSVGYGSPWKKRYFSLALRHISYGVFNGYDEDGTFTNTYNSSNTRVSGTYAGQLKKRPIYLGSKLSWVSSNLSNKSMNSLKLAIGNRFIFEEFQTSVGISFHEIDVFPDKNEKTYPMKLVLSSSKKLAYLPLTIYFDLLSSKDSKRDEYFLGGIFILKNKLMISYGSSSRKITQNINKGFIKTILGATGFGLSYDTDIIIIKYGNYFYGTGAEAKGFSIEVKF